MEDSSNHRAVSFPADRLSWLWLAVAAVMLPFIHIQTVLPVAAWLAPVFLMRFVRTQRIVVGVPVMVLVYAAAALVGMRNDFTTLPFGPLLLGAALAYGLIFSAGYIADRVLSTRLTGLARTLVFPLTVTSVDYLMSYSPFLTYGSPAYTQYGNLPLAQLASVTGMWGLTFIIAWVAPAVNAVWEQGFAPTSLRRNLAPVGAALLAVLLLGGARIAFFPPDSQSVRVAGIAPSQRLWKYLPVAEIARLDEAARAKVGAEQRANIDDLFARSKQEAEAGAKVVVWAETAAFILAEDETAMLERASALAREEGIYLQMGLMVIKRTSEYPYGENRAVMLDPAGKVVWNYHKGYPVPVGDGLEVAAGPRVIPWVDTPYGRIATAICYDADVPGYIRQAGQAGADLLLLPSDDWPAIEYDHAQMSTFRAVENGIAIVRPTSKGISLAVDHLGRVLAFQEYYSTDTPTIVAAVPTSGSDTIYPVIGDAFAYASLAGLLGVSLLGFLRRFGLGVLPRREPAGTSV